MDDNKKGLMQAQLNSSFAGVVLLAQIIDNLVTVPVFIANTVGLHALAVPLGVIVFGYFFGFIGMLVAIPVIATSKIIFMGLLQGLGGNTAAS